MLGAYNGVILQADVSKSADMSRAHRVAIYTRRFASRFPGPTNRHDKSQRLNRPLYILRWKMTPIKFFYVCFHWYSFTVSLEISGK